MDNNTLNINFSCCTPTLKKKNLYKDCFPPFVVFLFFSQFTDEPVFTSQGKYRATTQLQLKEMLYRDIIDYFDKGKVNSPALFRTLRRALQNVTPPFVSSAVIVDIRTQEEAFFVDQTNPCSCTLD